MNVRYFMRKRERYKHLLNLFANFVMLVAETAMFAFIWYKMYVPELEDKFWNRGNWAVIGMYALVLFFLSVHLADTGSDTLELQIFVCRRSLEFCLQILSSIFRFV